MKKTLEIENLNLEDLDVKELEKRLEMSMLENEESGWINTCPDKGNCPGLVTNPCPTDCNQLIQCPGDAPLPE